MICQCCNERSAVVERGQSPHSLMLCMDCLAAAGLHHLKGWSLKMEAEPELRCPTCYLGWREFSRQVRYGCPDCRKTFSPQLEALLECLEHPGAAGTAPPNRDTRQLELNLALLIEDYELAARIRDEMDHDPE